MPTDGERLATLEEQVRDFGGDMAALTVEMGRARDRLHALENSVSAFVVLQKQNRRQEARQYQRLGLVVGFGGLLMSVGMFVLAGVTIWLHAG